MIAFARSRLSIGSVTPASSKLFSRNFRYSPWIASTGFAFFTRAYSASLWNSSVLNGVNFAVHASPASRVALSVDRLMAAPTGPATSSIAIDRRFHSSKMPADPFFASIADFILRNCASFTSHSASIVFASRIGMTGCMGAAANVDETNTRAGNARAKRAMDMEGREGR